MSKILSNNLFLKTATVLFLMLGIHQFAATQNNIYLEPSIKFEEAYPGLQFTSDGKYLIKGFTWFALGKHHPLNFFIFDAKSYKLIRTTSTVGQGYFFWLSDNSKNIIAMTGEKSGTAEYINIESGKKVSEIPNVWIRDVIQDSTFLRQPAFKSLVISDKNTKREIEFESNTGKPGKFCNNGENVITMKNGTIILWDAKTGKKIDEFKDKKVWLWNEINYQYISPDTKHFTFSGWAETYFFSMSNNKIQLITTFKSPSSYVWFDPGMDYVYLVDGSDFKKYNARTGVQISSNKIITPDETHDSFGRRQKLVLINKLPNSDYFLITDNRNVTHIFSTKTNKVEAYLYTWGDKDYAFVTPDGRMEGTSGAIEMLQWVSGNQKTPLSATYDQMYTPNLMSQVFSNTLQENTVSLESIVKFTPEIKITSPKTESKTSSPSISLTCELKENGDEIKQVRIFVNDKLVSDETRGMKAAGNTATYNVTLLPGLNSVKAVAITKNGYQSGAGEVTVTYSGTVAESKLFVLAIGIDKYRNTAYNLNYAAADASSIVDRIKSSGAGIFKSINVYSYQNESAKRDSILVGFDKIAAQAQPQDAFILFYAGHGVMSEGTADVPKDFYLVLQDITQLYGNDKKLKERGISAVELRELSKKISAQKQVVFLDACQSGAAVETFAMRGAAEEKAILQLARSTGSYLIASTGTEQYATEFKELGHGVFTYAILQALSCTAEGSVKDKKITIQELSAYLNDNIPTLTEKYHGTTQYPKAWSVGMDFPIAVCK